MPKSIVREAIDETAGAAAQAIDRIEAVLPADFPERIHRSVRAGVESRLRRLALPQSAS